MKNCEKIKANFVEALYGELAAPQITELKVHLKECQACASEYEEMKATLGIMSQKVEEKPAPVFWEKFTDNVMEQVVQKNKKPANFIFPKWTYRIVSAAALIILGVFIGRFFNEPQVVKNPIAGTQENQQANIYQAAVTHQAAQYIAKSKILLLGVVNMDTENVKQQSMDFSHQREVSRGLVHEAAVLKEKLTETDQMRLKTLIAELELILMQISNYEKTFDVPAIELIKSSVDNQGVLMKINVEEMIMSSKKEIDDKKNNKNRIRL